MVAARLAALRDFLLLFFFLSIGATLELSNVGQDFTRAAVFSLFVLIGNPLIVILIMAWMGYRARTGFLAGVTVAQISEFSLVFMAMGLSLGHVDQSAVGLVTLVGLVTIAGSVYMITYSQQLYAWLRPLLRPLDFGSWREAAADNDEDEPTADVIIFGLGRFGSQLLRRLEDGGYNVLGVDLDPQAIKRFARRLPGPLWRRYRAGVLGRAAADAGALGRALAPIRDDPANRDRSAQRTARRDPDSPLRRSRGHHGTR
jgi:FlaA1/EpsC-like NDP-sugar epimerase